MRRHAVFALDFHDPQQHGVKFPHWKQVSSVIIVHTKSTYKMFEWDERKSASNLLKHGISFEEARLIFEGPVVSWMDDRQDYGETRTISIGLIYQVVAVAVVHTDRQGKTRLISARLANRQERKFYDDHQQKTS
jgi:uncharacterized DUF497 family protein